MVDVMRMRGRRRRVQVGLIAAFVGLPLAAGSPSAFAETLSTAQARDAGAGFLATAPPPASIGSICMVDTGVDHTPDTEAVQARISLWDDVVGDASPTRHGTLVATLIAAPLNGWGMVGIWPSARVVSIRANTTGTDAFTVASYYQAMRRCVGVAGFYNIRVLLLALGSDAPLTDEETVALNEIVTIARTAGINVVAASGNNGGGPLETPAQLAGVLSVGGAAPDGALCGISAIGARILAPGCGVDAVDFSTGAAAKFDGTTAAAAVTAAALAALRSWRPELTPDDAEHLVLTTAVAGAGGGRIDVAGAFRAAGLAAVVEGAPPVGAPPPQPPPPDDGRRDLAPPKTRLPRPRARVQRTPRRPNRIQIRLRNLPRSARAVVSVTEQRRRGRGREAHVVARHRTSRRISRVRVRSRKALRVSIRYVDPARRRLSSRTFVARVDAVRRGRRR